MKILIVGGGVAGPALARFLKDDAEITLIDKAPQWGNIGYAISLWGNGRQILKDLDLDHTVLKEGYEVPWSVFENKKGKILTSFTFDVFHLYGSTMVVTRTALQQALVKGLESSKNIKIKLGTTVSSLVQDNAGVLATLTDGSTEKFDLVVGADGIHSQIREMVFGKNFLKYYGWSIYAFWTPKNVAPPKGSIEFESGGKICFIYPMEDRAVVMLALATKSEVFDKNEKSQEVLHEVFSDFKDSVGHMIDAIEDPAHIFKDHLAYIDMERWYEGRVVLMGDAQHAISPITGMGSSMALEDAYVLADELKKVNMENIPFALEQYQKRRGGRIKRFHKISDFIESVMMIKSPWLSMLADTMLEIIPISFFVRKIEKILAEKI